MKKNLFLLSLLVLCFQYVSAQTYVTIPDANFRAELKQLCADCFNANDEMDITCPGVVNLTGIDIANKDISNIDGIQYFTKLLSLNCSNSNITSLGELPETLFILIANNSKIETILEFPASLTHIEINKNLIVNLPAFPISLDYFSANFNKIKSLPELPATMRNLYVGYNDLSELPALPEGIYDIFCTGNKLTSIPDMPSSLVALMCSDNYLTSLPAIPQDMLVEGYGNCFTIEYLDFIEANPANGAMLLPNRANCDPNFVTISDANFRAELKKLYPTCFNTNDEMNVLCSNILNATSISVSNKNIASISGVEYFTKLETIDCSNNNIVQLGALPASLKNLLANNNKIETILAFPASMIHIEIENNLIVNLPAFPNNLDFFSANFNKIESLPEFPLTLQRLFVGHNNLTVIPTFPAGMYDILCSNNKLTNIPNIPPSLAALFCSNNFLTSLPAIPEMTMVFANGNCFTTEYLNSIVIAPRLTLGPNRTDCNIVPQENFVVIPDPGFRAVLKELYPTCFNSNNEMNVLCTDILTTTNMDLISKGISDLTGIEYFSSLEHLNLNNNFISALSNLPSSLTYLDCSTNTLVNLSNLPANLIHLDCRDNYLTAFPTVSNSNSRVNSTQLTLPENLEYLNASGNCLDEVVENPNPVVLTTFIISPNRVNCFITTGVSTTNTTTVVNVYPNPANDKITIEVSDHATISIYNSTGQTLLQKDFNNMAEIDISSFVPGMYYYTIGDTSGKLIVK